MQVNMSYFTKNSDREKLLRSHLFFPDSVRIRRKWQCPKFNLLKLGHSSFVYLGTYSPRVQPPAGPIHAGALYLGYPGRTCLFVSSYFQYL